MHLELLKLFWKVDWLLLYFFYCFIFLIRFRFFDTSKQAIGALVIHFANVYLSQLFTGDPCTWLVLDCLNITGKNQPPYDFNNARWFLIKGEPWEKGLYFSIYTGDLIFFYIYYILCKILLNYNISSMLERLI